MKFHKKRVEMLALYITAFALIITMFYMVKNEETYHYGEEKILVTAITLVCCLFTFYYILVIVRNNPSVHIFISYSLNGKDTAAIIYNTLTEQFPRLSKYRFAVTWDETIPLGEEINKTLQDFIKRADVVIVIVSSTYINSTACQNEFNWVFANEKKIIPVVLESYDDLSRLPRNISNIKALPLYECKSDEEKEKYIIEMAKDLIRQRKD